MMSTHRQGLEPVRKKPGMYIGGTDERALNNCVSELIANSVEHHLAGSCSSMIVTVHGDGSASVRDDGPGISVTVDPGEEISYLELAFTTLFAPGRQPKPPYRVSGSNGVGAKCVNAVSEWMVVTTVSNGEEFQITFRGKVKEPLRKCIEPNSRRGTTIQFKPDAEIFGDKTFDSRALTKTLEQLAMLHPGLDIWFVDERPNPANRALASHFLFPNGSADYLNLILPIQTRIDYPGEPVQIFGEEAGVKVSVAFLFSESINTLILSFVNSSQSLIGGTHVAGFLRGLTDAVNQFAGQRRRFEPHEVRIGLSAIVSVWLANPMYAGAMKLELINPEAAQVVRKLTFEKVRAWIEEIQKSEGWFIERLEEQRSPGFGLE